MSKINKYKITGPSLYLLHNLAIRSHAHFFKTSNDINTVEATRINWSLQSEANVNPSCVQKPTISTSVIRGEKIKEKLG